MTGVEARDIGQTAVCHEICLQLLENPRIPLSTRRQIVQLLSGIVENFKTALKYLIEATNVCCIAEEYQGRHDDMLSELLQNSQTMNERLAKMRAKREGNRIARATKTATDRAVEDWLRALQTYLRQAERGSEKKD